MTSFDASLLQDATHKTPIILLQLVTHKTFTMMNYDVLQQVVAHKPLQCPILILCCKLQHTKPNVRPPR
jgi:hypothetical protein